jgi:N-acetyltransferase 10
MVRKRLDDRIRFLLERSVRTNQRSMLILVGDRGKDQIPNLYQILNKTMIHTTTTTTTATTDDTTTTTTTNNSNSNNMMTKRPKVLWCYKKELGFSTHKMKRLKKLKRDKARGLLDKNNDSNNADNFELFISQTDINWCYYRDSHRILGSTVQMLVLQDFEAMTPNLMARTMETVSGGGLIILLFHTVSSLQQLYVMTMDVHNRYRNESSTSTNNKNKCQHHVGEIIPRFNERFILSLSHCMNCLICDDELNVLPISRKALKTLSSSSEENPLHKTQQRISHQQQQQQRQLEDIKESLLDTPHIGVLVELTKTLDQAKALLVFLDACSEKDQPNNHHPADQSAAATKKSGLSASSSGNQKTIVSMTAARGRGKSATIGLCLAGAVSLGYSSIAITSPEPENCIALFDFIIRGLKVLKYQEHMDYSIAYNNAKGREQNKCIISIHIYKTHRQIIQYIAPNQYDQFLSCEIIAIDEAAAIPLPIVKTLLQQKNITGNDRLLFLSSTINGYEGTGRALSLKLIKELRELKIQNHQQTTMDQINHINQDNSIIARNSTRKGDVKVHEQRWTAIANAISSSNNNNDPKTSDTTNSSNIQYHGPLREIELNQPIRYAEGDTMEYWLNKLLCLDSASTTTNTDHFQLNYGIPIPSTCELYHVDRDALFSYHTLSEAFLQKIMNLYTSAHYKNSPNDLQMLSDAPAHALFVLLSSNAEDQVTTTTTTDENKNSNNSKKNKNKTNMTNNNEPQLPDVLVVMQVAYEGKISRKVVEAQLARGHRSAGGKYTNQRKLGLFLLLFLS